jgi:hypothetical protein
VTRLERRVIGVTRHEVKLKTLAVAWVVHGNDRCVAPTSPTASFAESFKELANQSMGNAQLFSGGRQSLIGS